MQRNKQAIQGRWAVSAMFAVNGFSTGAWAPQIPLLLPRYQITEATLGLMILVLGLGAVGAMLFAGRLISAYGSRPVLRCFAFAYIVTLPLVIFAPTIWLAALAMALFGAVMGSMDVAMNANAVEVERRLGYAIMSASHGFWSLGAFVGGVCGSYIIATWGAEVQALCVGTVTAVVVMAASPRLIAEVPQSPKPDAVRQPIFTRDLSLWTLGLLALFSMVPEGAVMDWAAIYLNKELGADLFRSGLAFAFFAGVMAIMRFVGDRIRNRFGAVKTIRYSGLISAVGMLIAATSPTYVFAIIGFSISGIGVANMIPILFSAAGNQPGHNPGVAISTVTMLGYAGILFAPSIIGAIAEHIGFRVTYAALSLMLLFVAWQAGRAVAADGVRAGTQGATP